MKSVKQFALLALALAIITGCMAVSAHADDTMMKADSSMSAAKDNAMMKKDTHMDKSNAMKDESGSMMKTDSMTKDNQDKMTPKSDMMSK